jgi:tetratricopeptide (TPR) repeat protein
MFQRIKAILAVIILLYSAVWVTRQYLAQRYYPTEISSLWKDIDKGQKGNELIHLLEEAIELTPSNADYYYKLANMYMEKVKQATIWRDRERRKDLLSKAIKNAQMAVSLNPVEAEYHLTLGWVQLLQSPQFKKPLIHFERALSLAGTSAYVNYSVGYYYLNNWMALSPVEKDRAVSILQRTINLSHRYSSMVFDKAWNEIRSYDVLKQIIPDTAQAHISLADYLKTIGMLTESAQEYEKAVALEAVDPGRMAAPIDS